MRCARVPRPLFVRLLAGGCLTLALLGASGGPARAQDDLPEGDVDPDDDLVRDDQAAYPLDDEEGAPAQDDDLEPIEGGGLSGGPGPDRDDALEPSRPDDVPIDVPAIAAPPPAKRVPRKPRFFRDVTGGLPPDPVSAVAVDPGDPEVYLAGVDGFIFKSDDGGESWRPTLSFPRGFAADMLVDDVDGADEETRVDRFTGNDRQVLPVDQTELVQPPATAPDPQFLPDDDLPEGDFDAGAVIRTVREDVGVRALVFVGASVGTVYAATPRGAYRSVDSGENWDRLEVPGGSPANDVRDIAVDPLRPSRIWLATRAGTLVSADGGLTFDAVNTGGRLPANRVLSAQIEGQDLVLVGTDRGLFRSWDGGQSFRKLLLERVSPNEPVSALAYDPAARVFYVGSPSGLFVGERRMAIFERRSLFNGSRILAISVDPLRPGGAAIGTPGEGLLITEDTGFSLVSLEDRFPAQAARSVARPGDDPDMLVVATERGVFVHKVGTGVQVSLDRWRAIQGVWAKEPTLREAVESALRYQKVHPEAVATLEQRAGLAHLAPELRLQYQVTFGRPEDQEEYVLVGDEPDDYDEDELKDVLDLLDAGQVVQAPQRGVEHTGWLHLRWDLDRVIFSTQALWARSDRSAQIRAEGRVANAVQVLYGARRRLMLELLLEGADLSPVERARRVLRLRELTSLLDGATGGAFSEVAETRGSDPGAVEGALFSPSRGLTSRVSSPGLKLGPRIRRRP